MAFNRIMSMMKGKGKGSASPTRSKGGSTSKSVTSLPKNLPPSMAENVKPPAPVAQPAALPQDLSNQPIGQPELIQSPELSQPQPPQQVNILPVGQPQPIQQPPMQPVESPAAPAPKPKAGQIRMPDSDEIGRILRRRPPRKPVRANKLKPRI